MPPLLSFGWRGLENTMSFLDLEIPVGNKTRPLWVVEGVDKLLSKIDSQDIWTTVDFIIKVWSRRFPAEAKQFFIEQDRYRDSRANDYASNKAQTFRSLVSLPPLVSHLFEKLLTKQIEAYDKKKFYREFSKKYPGFANYRKL